MSNHKKNQPDEIQNFTDDEKALIRNIFGTRYTKRILEIFKEDNVLSAKGTPYSKTYLRQVFNNIYEDISLALKMLEATYTEKQNLVQAKEKFKQAKKNIVNKKAVAVTTA